MEMTPLTVNLSRTRQTDTSWRWSRHITSWLAQMLNWQTISYLIFLIYQIFHNIIHDLSLQWLTSKPAWFLRTDFEFWLTVKNTSAAVFTRSDPFWRGPLTPHPHLALQCIISQHPLQWNQVFACDNEDKTKLYWPEKKSAEPTSCSRFLSVIDLLKVTAQTSAEVDWPFRLVHSNTRWPVSAQADYHSNSFSQATDKSPLL